MEKEDEADLGCLILVLLCLSPFIILMLVFTYS